MWKRTQEKKSPLPSVQMVQEDCGGISVVSSKGDVVVHEHLRDQALREITRLFEEPLRGQLVAKLGTFPGFEDPDAPAPGSEQST